MPTDLDDLFTSLGRHADGIPLAPAEQARHRGRQRTRNRAMVAAAAAVCLIAAGLGVVLVRHDRQSAPVTSKRTLPTVGAPVEFGDQARAATVAGTDGRLYTAWQTLNGQISMNAVELRTGAVAWPARPLGSRTDELLAVNLLPRALVVTLRHGSANTMHIFDPADGRERWALPFEPGDDVVRHESVVVRASANGRTEAFDWASGVRRWQQPAPADRPVYSMGTYLDRDEDLWLGRPFYFTDDRLVQVTRAGKVQVRDITTGELKRTVAAAPPDTDPRIYFAYDGWLYNDEHECCEQNGFRVRATDLRSAQDSSKVVFTRGPGHQLDMLQMCGELRVCVSDQDRNATGTVSVLDAATGRQLWQVPGAKNGTSVSTVHGYTLVGGSGGQLVVYDRDGKRVLSTPEGSVSWLDTDTLLLRPSLVAGPASRLTLPDGKVTVLGEVPPASDACAWTPERLACPVGTSLRIWNLSG
ncbi:PQQ-binding-like beta-propeller repeat protein [Actinoplanes sp. NPDC048791]|uniref:outer membrane protein assembly factor BamB family protein n=1 Tax=Actinoplanes sp. NPDC048791 TaxID=3154623 RepID=UPI0033D71B77